MGVGVDSDDEAPEPEHGPAEVVVDDESHLPRWLRPSIQADRRPGPRLGG